MFFVLIKAANYSLNFNATAAAFILNHKTAIQFHKNNSEPHKPSKNKEWRSRKAAAGFAIDRTLVRRHKEQLRASRHF